MATDTSRTSPVAAAAIGIAVLTGVIGDFLVRTERPGLNVWLLSLVFQVSLVLLHRRHQTGIPWTSFALLFLSGSFFLSFAWRDSPALNGIAFLAGVTAAGLAAWLAQGASLLRSTPMQYVVGLARSAAGAMVGILPLALKDADWSPFRVAAEGSRLGGVGRGLALAIPPVIVFGGLFAAADPIFSSFYREIFDFDLDSLISHGVVIGFLAWGVAGFLREMVVPGIHKTPDARIVSGARLGFTETMVVMGSVSLVFLLFVAIQLRTLFGGDAFVLAQTGLTYAEYAREGFFHMAWAAALVLPMLLFLEWVGRRSGPVEERSFHALAILLLFLLGLVLLSAVHRMRIYQQSYGLTELRVYTVAFMAWLGPVLAWFGLTVLAGRRERFVPGALSLAFAGVLALHLINPDRLIARTNLERAVQGLEFDVRHAVSLSDDAMPVMVKALEEFTPKQQCILVARMQRQPDDWRSWNLSRWRARNLLQTMEAKLATIQAGCQTTILPQREES